MRPRQRRAPGPSCAPGAHVPAAHEGRGRLPGEAREDLHALDSRGAGLAVGTHAIALTEGTHWTRTDRDAMDAIPLRGQLRRGPVRPFQTAAG
jgi:hypothetical protein